MFATAHTQQMEWLTDALMASESPVLATQLADVIARASEYAEKVRQLASQDHAVVDDGAEDDEVRILGCWENRQPEVEQGVVFTTADDEKALADRMAWDRESFIDFRAPLLAFEPADFRAGFRPDPRRVKNERALEMEYGPKRVEYVEDFVRDEDGYILLDDAGARQTTQVAVTRQGSVGWLYDRLCQVGQDGKPRGLPWMPKATYAWFRNSERRHQAVLQRRQQQRQNIVHLARRLGRDPKSPTFAAWVRDQGYAQAQAKLLAAYSRKQREEVAAA